jgi:hypothetical protein
MLRWVFVWFNVTIPTAGQAPLCFCDHANSGAPLAFGSARKLSRMVFSQRTLNLSTFFYQNSIGMGDRTGRLINVGQWHKGPLVLW